LGKEACTNYLLREPSIASYNTTALIFAAWNNPLRQSVCHKAGWLFWSLQL